MPLYKPFTAAKSAYKKKVYKKTSQKSYAAPMKPRARRPLQDNGYVDLNAAFYNHDTTGSIVLVPTIAQGTSVNTRIGKKAMLKSIQCRGFFANGTTATYNDCAMLLVYDKRPTGQLPAITDILVSASAVSFNNDVNSGRFKILKRVDFEMLGAPSITTGTDVSAISADFYLKVNLPIVFKALGTGVIADIEEGALYLVTVGINVPGNTAAVAYLSFRTRFNE